MTTRGELEAIVNVIEREAGAGQKHPTQWDNSKRSVQLTAHSWEQVLRILRTAAEAGYGPGRMI